jgi:hypothetical protein
MTACRKIGLLAMPYCLESIKYRLLFTSPKASKWNSWKSAVWKAHAQKSWKIWDVWYKKTVTDIFLITCYFSGQSLVSLVSRTSWKWLFLPTFTSKEHFARCQGNSTFQAWGKSEIDVALSALYILSFINVGGLFGFHSPKGTPWLYVNHTISDRTFAFF